MRWRTEGHPDDGTLCFCEILHRGKRRPYVLKWVETNAYWSAPGFGFDPDETDRWCPVDEIIEELDKAGDGGY